MSDGRVIFIPWTISGDRVRACITKESKNYIQGKLIEILVPSASRIKPPCPVFGRCGGCEWQHIPYPMQWETKIKGVLHALQRSKISLPSLDFSTWLTQAPAMQVFGYRNRIQLRGRGDQVGFYKSKSKDLVTVTDCLVARPEINASLEEIRHKGKNQQFPFKVEIEVLENGSVRKVWNSPHSFLGFRQINDEQNAVMKTWISHVMQGGDVLLDLFGGNGNCSKVLLDRFREIHCIDLNVPYQRSPAEALPRFYFHKSSVISWLLKWQSHASSVIIDPPREGLHIGFEDIACSIERAGVREMLSIGCHLDSWVRDLSAWTKRGWELKKVLLIDFFPQTSHVEVLGLLNR